MYTVEKSVLPPEDFVDEAAELMNHQFLLGFVPRFSGEVYVDTDDPQRFKVALYSGKVVRISLQQPPSFTIRAEIAEQQIASCDCKGSAVDDVFDDLPQVMLEMQLSDDLDKFAGTEWQDPHYEPLPLEPGTEVTVRFDRLGGYGVVGRQDDSRLN